VPGEHERDAARFGFEEPVEAGLASDQHVAAMSYSVGQEFAARTTGDGDSLK
jgi:hypothetical protein